MAKKVSEKRRKEIRRRLNGLAGVLQKRWYIIARDERESVEQAFICIDKDDHAEIVSDDGATYILYDICSRMRIIAEEHIEWLNKEGLFIGSKFTLTPEEDEHHIKIVNCKADIDHAVDSFEESIGEDESNKLNEAMDKIKEHYGEDVFFESCEQLGLSKVAEIEVDDAEVQACVDEINRATLAGLQPSHVDLAYIKTDYGEEVFFEACRQLDLELTEE